MAGFGQNFEPRIGQWRGVNRLGNGRVPVRDSSIGEGLFPAHFWRGEVGFVTRGEVREVIQNPVQDSVSTGVSHPVPDRVSGRRQKWGISALVRGSRATREKGLGQGVMEVSRASCPGPGLRHGEGVSERSFRPRFGPSERSKKGLFRARKWPFRGRHRDLQVSQFDPVILVSFTPGEDGARRREWVLIRLGSRSLKGRHRDPPADGLAHLPRGSAGRPGGGFFDQKMPRDRAGWRHKLGRLAGAHAGAHLPRGCASLAWLGRASWLLAEGLLRQISASATGARKRLGTPAQGLSDHVVGGGWGASGNGLIRAWAGHKLVARAGPVPPRFVRDSGASSGNGVAQQRASMSAISGRKPASGDGAISPNSNAGSCAGKASDERLEWAHTCDQNRRDCPPVSRQDSWPWRVPGMRQSGGRWRRGDDSEAE